MNTPSTPPSRVTVRAVLRNVRGEFYFVQHHERNPLDRGKWATIGGGLDAGDASLEAGLRREIIEEFGAAAAAEIEIGALLFRSDRMAENGRGPRVDHFFEARFKGELLEPVAPEEIIQGGWFSLAQIATMSFFFGFEAELARQVAERR